MWPVSDLRSYLSGRWRVTRTMVDLRDAIRGTLEGTAQFTPVGGSLLYKELGTLSFGAHRGPAEQQLDFAFPSEVARAEVAFRDGRAFHPLDLSRGEDNLTHACNPDLYEGRFLALDANRWQSTWKVTGPRKDQQIATLYTRLN